MTSLLQLATRAGIPRQSEIRSNCRVASSSLHSLLILMIPFLSTNGTSAMYGSIGVLPHGSDGITPIELGSIDPDVKEIGNDVFIRCIALRHVKAEFLAGHG